MKEFSSHEPLDDRLISILNLLKDVPERDPKMVEKNENKFYSELDYLNLPSRRPSVLNRLMMKLGILPEKQENKENGKMKKNKLSLVTTIVAIVVIVVIVLFGGTTATVLAAQNSIPGDTLYSVKTRIEQTRLSLTRNSEARIELELEFAEQRLGEIETLINEGRFQNIKPAISAFEMHIINALDELNKLAEDDPIQASRLMARLTESLTRYASALSDMSGRVPEPLRGDMEQTVITLGGGNENINTNGNDNLNKNENINSNYNENLNESLNTNTNESFDDNTNDSNDYNYNDSNDYNYNDNNNYNYNDNNNNNWNGD